MQSNSPIVNKLIENRIREDSPIKDFLRCVAEACSFSADVYNQWLEVAAALSLECVAHVLLLTAEDLKNETKLPVLHRRSWLTAALDVRALECGALHAEPVVSSSSKPAQQPRKSAPVVHTTEPQTDRETDTSVEEEEIVVPPSRRLSIDENVLEQICVGLKSIAFLSTAPASLLRRLAESVKRKRVKPGDLVVRYGDQGARVYFIERGVFSVLSEDMITIFKTLRAGECFGEFALLFAQRRTSTVRAETDAVVYSIGRTDFEFATRGYPAFEAELRKESVAQLLSNIPVFSGVSGECVSVLGASLAPVHFEPGDIIINQGDLGTSMYWISSGKVEIYLGESGQVLKVLESGDFFGEIALFCPGQPRSATCRAIGECEVLRLDFDAFERVMEQFPEFSALIHKRAEALFRYSNVKRAKDSRDHDSWSSKAIRAVRSMVSSNSKDRIEPAKALVKCLREGEEEEDYKPFISSHYKKVIKFAAHLLKEVDNDLNSSELSKLAMQCVIALCCVPEAQIYACEKLAENVRPLAMSNEHPQLNETLMIFTEMLKSSSEEKVQDKLFSLGLVQERKVSQQTNDPSDEDSRRFSIETFSGSTTTTDRRESIDRRLSVDRRASVDSAGQPRHDKYKMSRKEKEKERELEKQKKKEKKRDREREKEGEKTSKKERDKDNDEKSSKKEREKDKGKK